MTGNEGMHLPINLVQNEHLPIADEIHILGQG